MPKTTNNTRDKSRLPATESGPRPGDFPLGSVESRAVARALADHAGSSRNLVPAIIEYIGSPDKNRTLLVPRALAGLRLQFQPKQGAFDELLEHSLASWDGYGGSRGAAKSGYIRRGMLRRRLEYPGTSGQIIRRVWEDVRLNHVDKFFEEFPALLPYYHVAEHEVTIPTPKGAPSKIKFDSAETETDIKRKAYGPEFMDIFVDQAEQFSESELKLLKTSCRCPGTPLHCCKFGLFFNPGGKGAALLRRVFYTHEYHEREDASDFAFLQAYGWDNVEWSRDALRADGLEEFIGSGTSKDYYQWSDKQRFEYFITRSQYGRELNALPQAMRLGHLLGSFDKFAGQYYDVFDPERHVVPCKALDYWIPRWLGIDWGRTHNAVCLWNAQVERATKTYREMAVAGRSPKALAQEIVDRTPEEERKHIDAIYLSHDAFAERTSPDTIALQMGEVFRQNGMPQPTQADKDVAGGAMLLYELLRSDQWQIDPSCEALIECLPMVTRDEDEWEKPIKFDGDDAFEAARYSLKMRLGAVQPPREDRISKKLAERSYPGDPLVAVKHAMIVAEESRAMQPNRFAHRYKRWMPR